MKKIFATLFYIIVIFHQLDAQGSSCKVEMGALYLNTIDRNFKTDFGFYLHPVYFLSSKKMVSIGVKAEVVEIGKKNIGGGLVHVSGLYSYLITSSFYFTRGEIRPYVGVGVGIYNLTTWAMSEGENKKDFEFPLKYGASPKIGMDFGPFTVNIAYNWVYQPFANVSKIDYISAGIGGFIGGRVQGGKNNRLINFDNY